MVNINTSAISVDQTQSILSMSIPLFSCFLIPENCFTGIGFDSPAFSGRSTPVCFVRADFPVLLIAHTSISPVYNPVVYRRYHEDKIRQGDIAMLSDHESQESSVAAVVNGRLPGELK